MDVANIYLGQSLPGSGLLSEERLQEPGIDSTRQFSSLGFVVELTDPIIDIGGLRNVNIHTRPIHISPVNIIIDGSKSSKMSLLCHILSIFIHRVAEVYPELSWTLGL